MSLNFGEHSLALLRGITIVREELEKMEATYESTVKPVDLPFKEKFDLPAGGYTKYTIAYLPTNPSLPFYFEVRGIKDLGENNINYVTSWKPRSETNIDDIMVTGNLGATLTRFKAWADMIEKYGSIKLSRKEKFTAESAEQFYADFELVDEDANTTPFDNDKQFVLYKLLDYIKQNVEQEEGIDQEQALIIVNEIKLLQASIPNVTKATAIKGLSRIFAKTKSFSIKLIADFFDVAKKEALKAALYGGLHEADAFFHSIHILP